jgi:hypothetical protein
MRLFKYKEFLNESISTSIDQLLQSIDAEQIEFYYTLGINKDKFLGKNIQEIYDDSDFNNALYNKKLKKSDLTSTFETENFIKKQYDIKFFFLIDRDVPKIDTPKYIILQYSEKNMIWSDVYMYSVNGNIRNFFESMTSRTIEIIDGDNIYIYQTSNSGNNWTLQNVDDKTETFKDFLENDDIRNILNTKKLELNIIK